MTEPAVIIVRMQPPKETNPNWHGHWRRRAKAVAQFRAAAREGARYEATPGVVAFCGSLAPVRMDVEIAWAGRRKCLDTDNAIASLKPLRDGLSDELWGSEDKHVTVGTVTQRTNADGCVRVTLAHAEAPRQFAEVLE